MLGCGLAGCPYSETKHNRDKKVLHQGCSFRSGKTATKFRPGIPKLTCPGFKHGHSSRPCERHRKKYAAGEDGQLSKPFPVCGL